MNQSVFERIYEEVKKIPRGKTASYGEIATRAKTSARVVGFALHRNPDPKTIPCHRVTYKDGTASEGFAFGGKKEQERLLEEERSSFDKSTQN